MHEDETNNSEINMYDLQDLEHDVGSKDIALDEFNDDSIFGSESVDEFDDEKRQWWPSQTI